MTSRDGFHNTKTTLGGDFSKRSQIVLSPDADASQIIDNQFKNRRNTVSTNKNNTLVEIKNKLRYPSKQKEKISPE